MLQWDPEESTLPEKERLEKAKREDIRMLYEGASDPIFGENWIVHKNFALWNG